jgi:hypothetical protein
VYLLLTSACAPNYSLGQRLGTGSAGLPCWFVCSSIGVFLTPRISCKARLNPCELESPGSRRGRKAEFAGGRVLKGSHRLLPVGAPLKKGAHIMISLFNLFPEIRGNCRITLRVSRASLASVGIQPVVRQRRYLFKYYDPLRQIVKKIVNRFPGQDEFPQHDRYGSGDY